MRISQSTRRRAILIGLLVLAAFGSSTLHAGSMMVVLVLDPPTTAGSGIPAAGGFNVVSTRFGPKTWHLFAMDGLSFSYGIRNYSITLAPGAGGTIPIITHRSPSTQWDDSVVFNEGNGPYAAGFNDLRSGANVTPIVAGQAVANLPQIGGFGISASNFQAKTNALSYSATTNGQWGSYADLYFYHLWEVSWLHGDFRVRDPLFIAEGTYTGAHPTVAGASMAYWTSASLTGSAFAPSYYLETGFASPEPATQTLVVLGLGAIFVVRRVRA